MPVPPLSHAYIAQTAARALEEDVGSGDLTADLVPDEFLEADLICRQQAILAGTAFFDETFVQLDADVEIRWQARDGDSIVTDQTVCTVSGAARSILSAERSALNLLQTLSGTATTTRQYAELVKGTNTRILDTRKTLPGLRLAQKYAVLCGGGCNHRMGLYDGALIKENHLRAGMTIGEILTRATSTYPDNVLIEVEVENLQELHAALEARAKRILLDNFSLEDLRQAVAVNDGRAELEASGGIDKDTLRKIAETGVDYISVGAITKNVTAVDYSLLVKKRAG